MLYTNFTGKKNPRLFVTNYTLKIKILGHAQLAFPYVNTMQFAADLRGGNTTPMGIGCLNTFRN